MVCLGLLDLAADLHLFSLDLAIASLDFLCLGFHLVHIHFRSVLSNVLLAQLFLQICDGITDYIALASVVIDGFLHVIHVFFQCFDAGFQFLNLTAASQKVAVVLKRTTRHGTAWIEGFSLYRYHAQAVPVFSCNGNGVVNMIHHQNSS